MDANTRAKNVSWIMKHFGVENYLTIAEGSRYGYGVAISATPEREGNRFFVFKVNLGRDKRTPLGEYDTAQEAVDMMKLLIATERNDDGDVV
jgi:hypothetical protein